MEYKVRAHWFSLLIVFLWCTTCSGQVSRAVLDEKVSAVIGASVPLNSQLKGLPVVEPHISIDPNDGQHLLVAAMIVTDVNRPYESCRLTTFVSTDSGYSWNENLTNWWGYDPWTAIGENGVTVMSWIGTQGSFKGQYPLQLFTSHNGGITWDPSVQTLEGGHDGTKLTTVNDKFYLTTVKFRPSMGADVLLYEKQGENDFVHSGRISGKGDRLNFCEPVAFPDGSVLVPAARFMKEAWVQLYDSKELKPIKRMITQRSEGARGYMRMAVDAGNDSPFKDRTYFVRASGSRGTYGGILLNYSADKGLTWSNDTRVDLFADQSSSKAMVASAAVNMDGILCISWVDAQEDKEQEKHDLYICISLDGGVSFQRPVRVTNVSSDPQTLANADVANKFPGGGHYLDIASKPDGSFQLIWSDSRSGVFQLQTCNVKVRY